MNNLATRTISGAIFVTLLIGAMLLHYISFFVVFLIIELLTLWEFYSLFSKTEIEPQKKVGTVIGGLLFAASFFTHLFDQYQVYLVSFIPLIFAIFAIELYLKKKHPISNIAFTIFGIVYIAVPFSLMNSLVFFGNAYSGIVLLGVFLLIWIYDSFAYVFGVSFGKHRLFERISPKKSWEGFIGGAVIALLSVLGIHKYLGGLSLLSWIVIALIIIIFGTFGDLIESLFKRSIVIKDSGNIIPGHGGMLDRFDSVLMAIPIIATYLIILNKLF